MKALTITYPEDLAESIGTAAEDLKSHLTLMAALKLYELGQLSSGKAAELAGLTRVEFLEMCGRYRVPAFNYPPHELESELRSDLETMH